MRFPVIFGGALLALVALAFVQPRPAQAFAQVKPKIRTFVPSTFPAAGCDEADGVSPNANNGACSLIDQLGHVNGILYRVSAITVDTGDSSGGAMNLSGWNAADAAADFFRTDAGNGSPLVATGNSCVTVSTTATCTAAALSPFPATTQANAGYYISGVSVSAYNGPHIATAVTYAGAGCATITNPCDFSTISFTVPAATPAGTGGNIAFAVGFNLTGSWAAADIIPIIQHHRTTGTNNMPVYPFSQAYANTVASAWAAGTYPLRWTIKVGSTYYYNTANTANDICTTQGTTPFPATAPVTDGTCTWSLAPGGGTNALPQESVVGSGYLGGGNAPPGPAPPTGTWQATFGGAIYNINSGVGVGTVGNCAPSACTSTDVSVGFPLFFETPITVWINQFNTTVNDGHGNPGMIVHYATCAFVGQIPYIRPGGFDNGEWFGFLNPVIVNSAWLNLTYAQYRGLFIDYYAKNIYANLGVAYAAAAPSWSLDTATNCFANGSNINECLDYPLHLVQYAKAALPGYGFGNQGWSQGDLAVQAQGTQASNSTGFIFSLFDLYNAQNIAVNAPRHLQFIAPSYPSNSNPAHTPPAGNSGSFDAFEPLGPQHGVRDVEMFAQDVSITWDARYLYVADGCAYPTPPAGNCVQTGPDYLDAQANNYQSYYNAMAAGTPFSTSQSLGGARNLGNANLQ